MKGKKEAPPPEWIKPGAKVWYQSVTNGGDEFRYEAVVDTPPMLLGGHTWVCHLRDVSQRYHNGAGYVYSAGCFALTPRVDDADA